MKIRVKLKPQPLVVTHGEMGTLIMLEEQRRWRDIRRKLEGMGYTVDIDDPITEYQWGMDCLNGIMTGIGILYVSKSFDDMYLSYSTIPVDVYRKVDTYTLIGENKFLETEIVTFEHYKWDRWW